MLENIVSVSERETENMAAVLRTGWMKATSEPLSASGCNRRLVTM